jgi:type I restriction enzyme S subunit
MSEWKECKLGDVAGIQNGYAFKSDIFNDCNGIPVVKIKNVASGKLDMKDVKYYQLSIKGLENFIIKKNDILITMTGSHIHQPSSVVGKVARYNIEQKALLNQRVGKVYSLNERKLNDDYLYHFLKQDGVTYELALNASGSANQANISPELIKSLDFLLPPLPEQKAIVGVLSSLDDKIDLLHRQNKTLEAMAEALFRQWFVEEADEAWEEKSLSDIIDISIGRTPPRQEFHWFSNNPNDVKWISIKDLGTSGIFIFDTAEKLTRKAVECFNIPIIPKDTIVLSFKMTVGRVGITTEEMLSNEAIAHFIFNSSTPFIKEYLYFYLKTFSYDSLGSTSSIVTAINSSMIKELTIKIPPKQIMINFKEIAEKQFEKIKRNQIQIRTIENFRDTLLPKLMSGEVRVKA